MVNQRSSSWYRDNADLQEYYAKAEEVAGSAVVANAITRCLHLLLNTQQLQWILARCSVVNELIVLKLTLDARKLEDALVHTQSWLEGLRQTLCPMTSLALVEEIEEGGSIDTALNRCRHAIDSVTKAVTLQHSTEFQALSVAAASLHDAVRQALRLSVQRAARFVHQEVTDEALRSELIEASTALLFDLAGNRTTGGAMLPYVPSLQLIPGTSTVDSSMQHVTTFTSELAPLQAPASHTILLPPSPSKGFTTPVSPTESSDSFTAVSSQLSTTGSIVSLDLQGSGLAAQHSNLAPPSLQEQAHEPSRPALVLAASKPPTPAHPKQHTLANPDAADARLQADKTYTAFSAAPPPTVMSPFQHALPFEGRSTAKVKLPPHVVPSPMLPTAQAEDAAHAGSPGVASAEELSLQMYVGGNGRLGTNRTVLLEDDIEEGRPKWDEGRVVELPTGAFKLPAEQFRVYFGSGGLIEAAELKFQEAADGSLVGELGRGVSGVVYRAVRGGVQKVAVKVLEGQVSHRQRADFLREMQLLQSCRDRHVVQFYGAVIEEQRLMMVMELMEGGTLFDAIANDTKGEYAWHRRGRSIALDVVRGLAYLHSRSPTVVHLDLKSQNILLTRDKRPKIADVGFSQTIKASSYISNASTRGTFAWSAPELLLGERCSTAADIFSLGIILWEIVTQQQPVRGAMEPPSPDSAPTAILDLITACRRPNPSDRPTAKHVLAMLEHAIFEDMHLQRARSTPASSAVNTATSDLQNKADFVPHAARLRTSSGSAAVVQAAGSKLPESATPGDVQAPRDLCGEGVLAHGQAGVAAGSEHAGKPCLSAPAALPPLFSSPPPLFSEPPNDT